MANTMTKVAMVEELKAAGIILKNVKKMSRTEVEEKYNEYKNNTNKEEENMTTETTTVAENTTPATETAENTTKEEKNMNQNTVFTPATDRLPETEEKHTVYGMTTYTAPAPKKTRKPSKLTAVRENVLEAFLNLLPSTPWTYTTRNKKPVLDLRINDGKKIMVIVRYSNRGVQVMSKVEFPGSETHEKWSHPYAMMAKTAEDAIQTLTAIQTAIDQQEAEKKAKKEAEKKEEPKAE